MKVIPGDITEAKLGISESDMILLRNKVNIVFHAAATVRFDEDLKVAIEINLLGTQKVVEFCKQLENLEVSVALREIPESFDNRLLFLEFFSRLWFMSPQLIVIVIVAKSKKNYTLYHTTSIK